MNALHIISKFIPLFKYNSQFLLQGFFPNKYCILNTKMIHMKCCNIFSSSLKIFRNPFSDNIHFN